MMEVHRLRHVEWRPSPVVALAASLDGAVVAAARESGAVELWIVAPGSVGWHRQLTIPGKQDASISSLVWCKANSRKFSPRGRLFSAGLDGLISEWDLSTLEPKGIVKSFGGSVWDMATEPLERWNYESALSTKRSTKKKTRLVESGSDGDNMTGDESSDEIDDGITEQRVAVGCDDGCVRLYTVNEHEEGMIYKYSFPRAEGRALSVAWSADATKIFSGGSDGCIRCWDAKLLREVYRITVGLGGLGNGADLCVWSLLTLRDGTVVSGDSSGSSQFWDGTQGTLLEAHSNHTADVLSLAANPNQTCIYAAGADGQVIQYQMVQESKKLAGESVMNLGVGLGDKWVYVGSKHAHTHDVKALVVAYPLTQGEHTVQAGRKKRQRVKESSRENNYRKWAQAGVPMLVSGGSDAKLFTYPANAFLDFHPHDICFAPDYPCVKIAQETKSRNKIMMMVQHQLWLNVWKVPMKKSIPNVEVKNGNGIDYFQRKRSDCKKSEKSNYLNGYSMNGGSPNGHLKKSVKGCVTVTASDQIGRLKEASPELVARIKCKSKDHITCSALSSNGLLIGFSDRQQPRLFELEWEGVNSGKSKQEVWKIKKRRLSSRLPPAYSMLFSADSTRMILACPQRAIYVIDVEGGDVLHKFEADLNESFGGVSPVTSMCTSPDNQWLVTCSSSGDLTIFNLETFGQHWFLPPFDGCHVSAMMFHSGNSNALILVTSANKLHVLDVEAKSLVEWSKLNSSKLPKQFLEIPGGVQGLSMPSHGKSTVVAYGSKAMCIIDFSKPIDGADESSSNGGQINGSVHADHKSKSANKNFIVVPFKNPVLFVGHISSNSMVIVEKPWLDVLHELPPPVYRHLYGT